MISHQELKNFLELSQWWRDIIVDNVQKRLKRQLSPYDNNDLFLLAHEAKKLRRQMDWEIFTNADKPSTVDIFELALDKISSMKIHNNRS